MLTQKRLKELLRYSPETGEFVWRVTKGLNAVEGAVAGTLSRYVVIIIDRKKHYAHRLAWLYVHGHFPKEIDHKNRIKSDNRLNNLRVVNRAQNTWNTPINRTNTSGVKGVSWEKRRSRWEAYIWVDGKKRHLGEFRDLNGAAHVRAQAELAYRGKFSARPQ